MQISFWFCKTWIYLKILENIQSSVNIIDRLDITDEYSVKCDLILNTVILIDAALNISLRKCNVLWFYLFGQGVPNETKGMINLKLVVIDEESYLKRGSGRREHQYRQLRGDKDYTRFSFIPRTVIQWNQLPSVICLAESLDTF